MGRSDLLLRGSQCFFDRSRHGCLKVVVSVLSEGREHLFRGVTGEVPEDMAENVGNRLCGFRLAAESLTRPRACNRDGRRNDQSIGADNGARGRLQERLQSRADWVIRHGRIVTAKSVPRAGLREYVLMWID